MELRIMELRMLSCITRRTGSRHNHAHERYEMRDTRVKRQVSFREGLRPVRSVRPGLCNRGSAAKCSEQDLASALFGEGGEIDSQEGNGGQPLDG